MRLFLVHLSTWWQTCSREKQLAGTRMSSGCNRTWQCSWPLTAYTLTGPSCALDGQLRPNIATRNHLLMAHLPEWPMCKLPKILLRKHTWMSGWRQRRTCRCRWSVRCDISKPCPDWEIPSWQSYQEIPLVHEPGPLSWARKEENIAQEKMTVEQQPTWGLLGPMQLGQLCLWLLVVFIDDLSPNAACKLPGSWGWLMQEASPSSDHILSVFAWCTHCEKQSACF